MRHRNLRHQKNCSPGILVSVNADNRKGLLERGRQIRVGSSEKVSLISMAVPRLICNAFRLFNTARSYA